MPWARKVAFSWATSATAPRAVQSHPQMLSAEELISFWADEQMTADHPPSIAHRVSLQSAQVGVGGLGGLDADAAVDGVGAVGTGDDGA